ncbi:UvrD-helicase domain-containing protein [Rhizobium sp. AN5]|uniref:UvrD-helicase domain-containing protein n=1 Tax=Rhizobium sp. AN5 TaxID=1855304 RepID=UPI0039E0D947
MGASVRILFPKPSGLPPIITPRGNQWPAVYQTAHQLLASGSVDVVIRASYSMVLVDEYQDCTISQHKIAKALSRTVHVIVFGDPPTGNFRFWGRTDCQLDQ